MIASLVLAACTNTSDIPTEPIEQVEQTEETATPTTFTMEEIAKHNTKEDCWLLISNKVYDVTEYQTTHPGGEAILLGCGKDATDLFESRPESGEPHSEKARNYMVNFYIGSLN